MPPYVLAENPETGEQGVKRVVQTFVNETDELVHVTVDGKEIVTTPEHPFYVPSKGWTGAIHLRAGDILVLVNGEYAVATKVEHELLESPVKVYNFEVEDFHTYYVSDSGVLVHNRCTPKTEVHHIVEQSQIKKSGFSSEMIQADSNKITLDYEVHRKISGYYSSITKDTGGLRVRDWLAGQSFEEQTEFGWKIIKQYRGY